jgi:hypothetical protein
MDFFCINDTTDDACVDDPRLSRVRSALESMFTTPSPFERLEGVNASSARNPFVQRLEMAD